MQSILYLFLKRGRGQDQEPPHNNIIYWGPTEKTPKGHSPYGIALFAGENIDKNQIRISEGEKGHTV